MLQTCRTSTSCMLYLNYKHAFYMLKKNNWRTTPMSFKVRHMQTENIYYPHMRIVYMFHLHALCMSNGCPMHTWVIQYTCPADTVRMLLTSLTLALRTLLSALYIVYVLRMFCAYFTHAWRNPYAWPEYVVLALHAHLTFTLHMCQRMVLMGLLNRNPLLNFKESSLSV